MFHDRGINNRVNRIHERALRMIYNDDISTFEELLEKDGGFTIHEINLQTLAIELFKVKNGKGLEIMNNLFSERNFDGPTLRTQSEFVVPSVKTVNKGECSLRHLGPLIWNIVPKHLKEISTLGTFKEKIREWKPKGCPCRLCKLYIEGLGYIS